jgi:hypothetical protein
VMDGTALSGRELGRVGHRRADKRSCARSLLRARRSAPCPTASCRVRAVPAPVGEAEVRACRSGKICKRHSVSLEGREPGGTQCLSKSSLECAHRDASDIPVGLAAREGQISAQSFFVNLSQICVLTQS